MTLTTTTGATRLIRHGHSCLGVAGPAGLTLTAGGHNDSLLWSRNPASGSGQLHTWSPWGNGKAEDDLPGFNGERCDPVSGSYHLGNGYRAYNPVLRRFNCPDSLSPFGAGGINPYAYCAGDPVNHTDPTGHISWQGFVGIVAGAIGVLLTGGAALGAIAIAGSVAAAWSAASTTTLVVGGMGLLADATGIASGATEDSNPQASSVLGWVSMATGIAGMAAGFGAVGIQRMEGATAGAPWRTQEGRVGIEMSGRGAPVAAKQWAERAAFQQRELTDLPNEMLEQIFNYLDYTSLKSISAVENPRISAIAERRLLSIENSLKRINSFLGKSISPENRLAALQGAWHARPLNRLDVYAFEPAFNSIMNDIDNLSLKSRATYIKSTYKFSKDFGVIKDLTPISHQNAYSTVNKGMAYLLRSVDFNNV